MTNTSHYIWNDRDMDDQLEKDMPLVSVVITCFNHAKYLGIAIESVLNQTYTHWELVVIDDGSTDATAKVTALYPDVRYIYQQNAGLSAARNTGLKESEGAFIVFLDADDRLLPNALETGLATILRHPECGLTFGAHRFIDQEGKVQGGIQVCDFYMEMEPLLSLLKRNFIGMHAAVMYSRAALEACNGFNPSLKSCEDYDVYFKIATKHPIRYHHHIIAEYRKHEDNMSGDFARMLKTSLSVLNRHKRSVPDQEKYRQAYQKGQIFWKQYYGKPLFKAFKYNLRKGNYLQSMRQFKVLMMHAPSAITMSKKKKMLSLYGLLLRIFPALLPGLLEAKRTRRKVPNKGDVLWGDLDRVKPISLHFGYDRGNQPIDRFYIEGFLYRHRHVIKGNVLEIGERLYTEKFGREQVENSHIFHVDHQHPDATYTGDIASAADMPAAYYDCVIFTQTMQYIYDFEGAISQIHKILKPGGVLLLTVPGLSPISRDQWSELWLFNFSSAALKKMFTTKFESESIVFESYGNVKVATAAMYGLAAEEIQPEDFTYQDPLYQLVNTVIAIKS